MLSEIPLEGTGRYVARSSSTPLTQIDSVLTAEYKGNIYVKIAQLYLEEEESVNAETYINRASILMSDVKDALLILRFKVRSCPLCYRSFLPRQSCFARILDYKRKFLEASVKYYDLSQIVGEAERLEALKYDTYTHMRIPLSRTTRS